MTESVRHPHPADRSGHALLTARTPSLLALIVLLITDSVARFGRTWFGLDRSLMQLSRWIWDDRNAQLIIVHGVIRIPILALCLLLVFRPPLVKRHFATRPLLDFVHDPRFGSIALIAVLLSYGATVEAVLNHRMDTVDYIAIFLYASMVVFCAILLAT